MDSQIKAKNLETCLTLATALVIVYLFNPNIYLLYAAISIGLIGLLIPPLANVIRWAWFQLAELLGAVTSKILLGLLFFLFLSPIAFFYRLFRKNHFDKNSNRTTYWVSRDHRFNSKDLDNPW